MHRGRCYVSATAPMSEKWERHVALGSRAEGVNVQATGAGEESKRCKSHPAIRDDLFANGYLAFVGMKSGRLDTMIHASRDPNRASYLNGSVTQWRPCGVWRKIDFKEVPFAGAH